MSVDEIPLGSTVQAGRCPCGPDPKQLNLDSVQRGVGIRIVYSQFREVESKNARETIQQQVASSPALRDGNHVYAVTVNVRKPPLHQHTGSLRPRPFRVAALSPDGPPPPLLFGPFHHPLRPGREPRRTAASHDA